MFWGKKALKPNEKNLKNSATTLKVHYTFTYCLEMKNFITGPCLPINFVGLRLGFDVPEQITPLRCCSYTSLLRKQGRSPCPLFRFCSERLFKNPSPPQRQAAAYRSNLLRDVKT